MRYFYYNGDTEEWMEISFEEYVVFYQDFEFYECFEGDRLVAILLSPEEIAICGR